MKRSIVLAALSVLVGLAVGRLSQEPPANAAQPGGTKAQLAQCQTELAACEADLAECMAALEASVAQLAAAQAELAECQGNLGGYGLPATGQTKCYDNVGAEIPCDDPNYPGQDGFYQAGCPTEGRFVDNGDGTVTDTCTGLMWQKDTADINKDGMIGDQDRVIRQDALKYCDSLDFASHTDWRLPNMRELFSLVDIGRRDPTIDPVFGVVLGAYWSSSTYKYEPVCVWIVRFNDGWVSFAHVVDNLYHVRAVRNAP
jgi:hypothetical protein